MGSGLKALALLVAVVAVAPTATAADVSGTWDVDGSVYGYPVQFPCALEQQGGKLTGTAHIQEKDQRVTGTVEDRTVTFKFEVEHEGTTYELVFTGTLGSDEDMSGTIAVAGVTGEFAAKKK
jgi:hypothetical protein